MPARLPILVIALSGFIPSFLPARDLVLDEQRSFINFTVDALAHEVAGHVISFEAEMDFPHNTAFPESVQIRFKVTQLTTDHDERDTQMLNWLEAEKFPDAVFKLDFWEGSGSTRIAYGSLTLHGVTRSVDIPVTLSTLGPRIILTGETAINTRDFRLPKVRRAMVVSVSPTVEISFTLYGQLR